jgi:hypothetical protein
LSASLLSAYRLTSFNNIGAVYCDPVTAIDVEDWLSKRVEQDLADIKRYGTEPKHRGSRRSGRCRNRRARPST